MAEYPRGGSLCPRRGGEVYDLPSCPACEGMLGRSESPPRRGRRREGRTTVPAGPQLRAALPSRREASALGAGAAPAYTAPHASRGLWLERDRKRVPQAGARLPREEQERGTFLVSRHADACTAVQKLSSRWNGCAPAPHAGWTSGGEVNDLPSKPTCQACRPFGAPPRRRVPLGSFRPRATVPR